MLKKEEDYEIDENNEINECFRLFRYFRLFRNPLLTHFENYQG